jgi:hypothetical protein
MQPMFEVPTSYLQDALKDERVMAKAAEYVEWTFGNNKLYGEAFPSHRKWFQKTTKVGGVDFSVSHISFLRLVAAWAMFQQKKGHDVQTMNDEVFAPRVKNAKDFFQIETIDLTTEEDEEEEAPITCYNAPAAQEIPAYYESDEETPVYEEPMEPVQQEPVFTAPVVALSCKRTVGKRKAAKASTEIRRRAEGKKRSISKMLSSCKVVGTRKASKKQRK